MWGEAARRRRSRGRWKDTFRHQRFAQRHAHGMVDFEYVDGRPRRRRESHQERPVPAEVIHPTLRARVEQRYDLLRFGIDARDVRPLVRVAPEARQGEVRFDGRTAMFLRDDVVDLELQRMVTAGHPAVFAAVPRALPHERL